MPLPYRRAPRWSSRATTRALIAAALLTTMALGPVYVATASRADPPAPPTTRPTHGPGSPNFGTITSSGDAVVDCGDWADHTDDLPPAAVEAVETCLDFHGWEYSTD